MQLLSNFRFTDDITLFANNDEELKQLLKGLNKEWGNGMTKKKRKIKIMCDSKAKTTPRKGIIIDEEKLE